MLASGRNAINFIILNEACPQGWRISNPRNTQEFTLDWCLLASLSGASRNPALSRACPEPSRMGRRDTILAKIRPIFDKKRKKQSPNPRFLTQISNFVSF